MMLMMLLIIKDDLRKMLADFLRGQIKLTCAEEILLAGNELLNNRRSWLDKIPISEFIKYAPVCTNVWLADDASLFA